MVNCATSSTMIMADEIGGVAGDTLAASCNSRCNKRAIAICVVARATAFKSMSLTDTNKGRGGGGVAAHTIGRRRSGSHVLFNLIGVAVNVSVKVCHMTLGAGSTIAAIDRSVSTSIDSDATTAIDRIMTRSARGVNRTDYVTGVTIDTKCRHCHRTRMAVAVAVEISGMAASAGGSTNDGRGLRPIGRIFKCWWRCVAVGTPIIMNGHLAISRVTDCHAGRSILKNI